MSKPFSIIANNCWGAEVYKHYKKPFNTPIIGLFFYPDCYLKFVTDLDVNLNTELTFITQSKYLNAKAEYPVGVVNGSEIHFLHYETEQEAFEKWTKRCKRVKGGELFFKFDDRDGATAQHINQFLDLKLPNSICFTKNNLGARPNHVHIPMPQKERSVMDGFSLFKESVKYFDLDEWINGNGVVTRLPHTLRYLKRKISCALK